MIGRLLILVARGWQLTFSAILPPTCRFQPSCSAYAIEAIERHGALKGGAMAMRRIMRCHPWGGSGFDPVPGPAEARAATCGHELNDRAACGHNKGLGS